jgi:hypothetical protein
MFETNFTAGGEALRVSLLSDKKLGRKKQDVKCFSSREVTPQLLVDNHS